MRTTRFERRPVPPLLIRKDVRWAGTLVESSEPAITNVLAPVDWGDVDLGVEAREDIPSYSSASESMFYHVVSGPDSRYEQLYPNRVNRAGWSVQQRAGSIIQLGRLEGRPKGILVRGAPEALYPRISSVSLSLADVETLRRLFRERASEMALCFRHGYLSARGIRRVRHVEDVYGVAFGGAEHEEAYLFDLVAARYDFRWENEWRIRDSLEVTNETLSFVLTPERDLGGHSLDLKTAPAHKVFGEWWYAPEPDSSVLLDMSFEVPFISSTLITRPAQFLDDFLMDHWNEVHQDVFDEIYNSFGVHYEDVDALDSIVGSLGGSLPITDDTPGLDQFQAAWLEYAYAMRMYEDPLLRFVEESDIPVEWSRESFLDVAKECRKEILGFVVQLCVGFFEDQIRATR